MIEALVAYIEAKGYVVTVYPGYLEISKGLCCVRWMISQVELHYAHDVVLFAAADATMAKIDAALTDVEESKV